MPTYSYNCQNKECELEFECLQSIKEKAHVKCPGCSKKTLQRGIGGGIAIVIKNNTPTTLGSLGEKNAKRMANTQEHLPYSRNNPDPNKTPWWRKTKSGTSLPVDFKVLRDSKKYIETGAK